MLWLDGRLCAAESARIDPADRGFLLGDGVFETIRAVTTTALHLPRHLARLRAGADVLGIPLAWSAASITDAITSLLGAASLPNTSVRVTLSRGPARRGVLPPAEPAPTLLITIATLPPPAAPARVIISGSTRRNEASPLSRIKSLNYLDSILARREAAAAGADDAIMLDTRGRVAEATAANLFALRGGVLETPPVADGALPGIFRARLIEAGLVQERTLLPADLLRAEAMFLGNSLGVRMIAAIGTQPCDPDNGTVRALLRRIEP